MAEVQLLSIPNPCDPSDESTPSWDEFARELANDAATALCDSGKCPAGHELLHPESLSEEEVALLERHLESCARCAALVLSTSVELDDAVRVVALAAALEEERLEASMLRPGRPAVGPELQVDLAPSRRFGGRQHDDEKVVAGRGIPRRTIVDRLAGVGGLAVAAGAAVLTLWSYWEVQPTLSASGRSPLIATADKSRKTGSASTYVPRLDSVASADQSMIQLANVLFDKSSTARRQGNISQANELALKAFALQESASNSPTLAIKSLETLLPALVEQRELKTAEKLLKGALERKALDADQSPSLLAMFQIIYGPHGLNKPNELAAIRSQITEAESRHESSQVGGRSL